MAFKVFDRDVCIYFLQFENTNYDALNTDRTPDEH